MSAPNWAELARTELSDEHVVLRPIAESDREPLRTQALDPALWRYFVQLIETDEQFDAFFDAAVADQAAGERVVYVITDRASAAVAGSMSFCSINPAAGRLEIGWSWLGTKFHGQGINHWAKYLMLREAFDHLGAERVEFKTDALNKQARQGLRNIGAVEEGILRSFNPMPGNRRRDAVYYSVLRGEWPAVAANLLAGRKGSDDGS
ncbi:GNAT family N-acetyltransferase [Amycolatopsis magusensis]|uniref:RimJ/RimL family protein N-acetyltransferase n=1 Tax=Amycolatopsis magusensis TaxID=882444 RepID=A0ABS4PZR6_9PSEU|nr:GNAT family N-acetyltransferase [Amycolatopsis magusensis]MBP2184343.1 RimJ/RimL family protein N-acetyltransferase [Amycolatopsis magusensis]